MDHDDFAQEPIRGLPELLPEGEHILWQGSPSTQALARDAFKVRWVAGYFVLLFLWKGTASLTALDAATAYGQASFFLVLGALVVGLLYLVAWCQAASTVYTLTTARVVMRIGAALTMTVQIPFRWIGAADLDQRPDGSGSIALQTLGTTTFSYVMTWPHVRPWRFPTQPSLRCIPDAANVAEMLGQAAHAQLVRNLQEERDVLSPVPAE